MQASKAVRRPAVTIPAGASIAEAARMMDRLGIGALVVVDDGQPVGIVTDRDLAIRGLGRQLPASAAVDRIMSRDLVTLPAAADLHEAVMTFYRHPIRRLPLLDDAGRMVGMLTVDDLALDLVNDLGSLVRPIFGQVIFGGSDLQETADVL
jgi:CBS domain-containing protein